MIKESFLKYLISDTNFYNHLIILCQSLSKYDGINLINIHIRRNLRRYAIK